MQENFSIYNYTDIYIYIVKYNLILTFSCISVVTEDYENTDKRCRE